MKTQTEVYNGLISRARIARGGEMLYYRGLTLVHPDYSRRYGITADKPVFLSGLVYTPEIYCSVCGQLTQPLVLTKGQVTESPHFHQATELDDIESGIYYETAASIESVIHRIHSWQWGWTALLEPQGRQNGPNILCWGSAEKVMVTGIKAYCHSIYHNPAKPDRKPCIEGELTGGVFYQDLDGRISPYCKRGIKSLRTTGTFEKTNEGFVFDFKA